MIGFLHPWVLAGLVAAAIPVLLHLLARREPPTIVFPAVRYLVTTTREHQRRLKLQNWLLLLLRTLLIILIVLAAAGPTMPRSGVPGHAPSALALIVDNSASSGAVASGTPRLGQLRAAARAVLQRATPDDGLWLITADGIPRRGDQRGLETLVDRLSVSARRLDLGYAIGVARDVLRSDPRPGEIMLLTDLQATAVSRADPGAPLTVARPPEPPPPNVGVSDLGVGAQPWSPNGGRVTVRVIGDSGMSVPVALRLGDRPARQALARAGGGMAVTLPGVPDGWWVLTAELDPDELRLDDRRVGAVRVAPVARVTCDTASRYLAAACAVLESNRRIARGNDVTVGRLGAGVSIVPPPEDPAELGALNRALAARGVGWSFAEPSPEATATDSSALLGRVRVLRRYVLQPDGSRRTGVLATAGGAPWLVRERDVILLGSRLDPAWTELPVSADFMPLMDVLLNRLARGEVALVQGITGEPVTVPDAVTMVRQGEREWRVEGGGSFLPTEQGVYYLLAGTDTIGALSANLDPRESVLARAEDRRAGELWRGARVVDLTRAASLAFSAGSRGDLRGPLLWAALLVGLLEVGVASAWRQGR